MTSLARAADVPVARSSRRLPRVVRGGATFGLSLLTGAAAGLALTLLVPLAFHGRPLTVMSGSMEPAIMTGDVVIAMPVAPLEVRPGDIVSCSDRGRGGKLVTHRVRSMRQAGARVTFITRGDANTGVEKWRVGTDKTISRTALRLPKLGRALIFARSRTGLLVLVLVPVLLLAVFEITSIWRPETDHEDDPKGA